MKEEWRAVIGYVGYYEVSNFGRVKQLRITTCINDKQYTRNEKIKRQTLTGAYFKVGLTKDGKHKLYLVHRLVAEAFVINPCPDKFDCVNHKDENKLNNYANNLEWCDRAYNDNYGSRNSKLSTVGKEFYKNNKEIIDKRLQKARKCGSFKGRHHTDETKQKISSVLKDGYASGSLKPAMLGVHRYGKDAPRYGAKLSEETKCKISNSVKGFKHTDEAKKKMSDNVRDRIFVNDGKINKRVKQNELQYYLDNGFVRGRITPWQGRFIKDK